MRSYISSKTALYTLIVTIFSIIFLSTIFLTYIAVESQQPTGFVGGTTTVEVSSVVIITLERNYVYFGTMFAGTSNDTETGDTKPFVLRNDGNVNTDVVIRMSESLFSGSGSGNNSNTFQFKAGNCSVTNCGEAEANTVDWSSPLTATEWTNFADTNKAFVKELHYNNTTDEVEAEIKISIPSDEPTGNKSINVIFTGSESV